MPPGQRRPAAGDGSWHAAIPPLSLRRDGREVMAGRLPVSTDVGHFHLWAERRRAGDALRGIGNQ